MVLAHRLCKTHMFDDTDMRMVLEAPRPARDIYGTKVVVTLGPACHSVSVLVQLLEAGMTCARVDLTGGPIEYHKKSLRNLAAAVKQAKRLCAVILDTVGRELTIRRPHDLDEQGWPVYRDSTSIKTGQRLVVSGNDHSDLDLPCLPISNPDFGEMCEVGDSLFVGRYLVNGADESSLYLEVEEVRGQDVVCVAQNDALLEGLLTLIHKEREAEFHMSSVQARMPFQSDYDKAAIRELAAEFEIDYVALTYTCSAQDVSDLRGFLDSSGLQHTAIMAKVENRQGLESFADILAVADAILLSRGNLGLDVAAEKMAMVQKSAISACNEMGRPVAITRVVDTMVAAPRCTRAEATDVANAVLDGVDAIMLGAETLRGAHPINTVKTIRAICQSAEEVFDHASHFDTLMDQLMGGHDLEQQIGESGDLPPEITGADSRHSSLPPPSPRVSPPYSRHGSTQNLARPPSFGSIPSTPGEKTPKGPPRPSRITKLESMASTAVRAATKIQAGLIVVYANSGRTASLIAKYRPEAPILTLVVPQLKSTTISWTMEGRSIAKKFLLVRGVVPMLAAPSSGSGDAMLSQAIKAAVDRDLVLPGQYVVCVSSVNNAIQLKIIGVDDFGRGIHPEQGAAHEDSGQRASLDLSRPTMDRTRSSNGKADALNPNPVPVESLGVHPRPTS